MKNSDTFNEARRLHALGYSIHWLHKKSKRPIESGWTTGPRKDWAYLKETYIEDLNVGVRLGSPSVLGGKYLTVVDVDVKSTDERHRKEAVACARELIGKVVCPVVRSGRGNGSRHYHVLTNEPMKPVMVKRSSEIVKVSMPSAGKPSKRELEQLSGDEITAGIRLRPAWEIGIMGEGQQVVLPPSIHPDSGEPYTWVKHIVDASSLPVVEFNLPKEEETPKNGPDRRTYDKDQSANRIDFAFEVTPVKISQLAISDKVRKGIVSGDGVFDRSSYLLPAATALVSAGLSQNQILTVLTDPDLYLGQCAYEHAKTSDRARAAYWVYKYTLKRVAQERDPVSAFKDAPPVQPSTLSSEETAKQNKELEDEIHWTQYLIRGGQRGEGVPKSLVGNVVLILNNAVGDGPIVRRDNFAFRDTYTRDTPWKGKAGALISDDDVANIKYWLGQEYLFEPKKDVIYDALTVVACQNSYDPVKDMLDGLPEWDQTLRLDTWLKENFEAKGCDEYLAQVFRKWMVAMVMRAYRPGSKFDWMPIFEGTQGIGKSSFGRLLVGDKHFLDWLPNLNDKDAALNLQGMWGVEMGELSQFRRNELESIKAFVSRTVDKVRPPYGRKLMESYRRCVFFGTTNKAKYLIDDTGNRRFKPVEVGSLNFKALKRDRKQLFAEAKWLLDSEKETELTLELSGEAKVFERQIHNEKMVEDESNLMTEAMEDFIEKVAQNKASFHFEKFRISDLFSGVGPLGKWKLDYRNLMFATKTVKKMRGDYRRSQGKNYWKIDVAAQKEEHPPPLDFY